MTTKSFTPIFVPTDKPSNLILDNNKLGLTEIIHANKCHSNCNAVNQILLLINQEAEIKDGDYCAALDTKIIFKAGSFDMEGIKKFKHLYKKIIATSLLDQYSSLPSINQSDIQWMVEEYNKNGKLPEKVEVEMIENYNHAVSIYPNVLQPKTNPADGSIRIVKAEQELTGFNKYFKSMLPVYGLEKTYTREELRSNILKFWFHWYNHIGGTNTEEGLDKWMKENNL